MAFADIPKALVMDAAGRTSKFIADQGRREKVDNMRRMVSGQPKEMGPLSDEEKLALGLRGRFYDYLNND